MKFVAKLLDDTINLIENDVLMRTESEKRSRVKVEAIKKSQNMNFAHISISVHFVWLIWLSLQYYDHDAAIARIMGLVLPSDDVVGADDSGALDDVNNLDSSSSLHEVRSKLHDNDNIVYMHSKDLSILETEIPSHKRHQFNGNKKKRSTSEVMRGERLLSGSSIKKSSEINLKRKSMLKNDNNSAGDFSRRLAQKSNENNVKTKCFLMSYDNSTFVHTFDQSNIPNETSTFMLDFDLMTDLYSDESYWSLVNQAEENELIIDSKADDIELLPNVANKFKYSCFVTHKNQESQTSAVDYINKSKTCYTFTMSDEYGDGICCWGGSGFYSLKLNENIPLMSGRFYAYVDETKFCLGDDESTVDMDNSELLYPSRECIGETCLCDLKPKLLSNFDNIESRYSSLRELKTRIMLNIVTLSGTESLKDTNSPQYMAACWTLNDDPYLTQYESMTTEELDAETRMMQRYILAVHYFSTKPQNWRYDMNFLSTKSECEWYTFDEDGETMGVLCDGKNNIISVLFEKINLEGPLVDEFSGLKSLEFMTIVKEPLSGSIPSSFGLLSELRYLSLVDLSLVSTIPPELFNARKMERVHIAGTSITGIIPQSISKANGMQVLRLNGNHLIGEIPEELYSLTQLRQLRLNENKFSSTISSSIGNLNNLIVLRLDQNNLSGSLPSEIGRLIMLEEMTLSNNEFTSTVPSSLKYLSNAVTISLNENNFEGEVPDVLCQINPLPDIKADCRNDILQPDVKCTCCSYCVDLTPTWNGKCSDSTLKIVIDHIEDGVWFNSELLEWSITDTLTNKQIMGDKYTRGSPLKPVYEMCVASTDCLSLNMTTGAIKSIHDYPEFSRVGFETTYSIYWNDNLLITDTVASDMHNSVIHPEIIIQHDLVTNQVQEANTCVKEKEMICNGEAILLDPKQRVMYNNAIRVSGKAEFDDVDSPHSKALCWNIKNDSLYEDTDFDELEALSTQRYVLTLLHLVSVSGLFGDGEYPPLSNECSWEGITCTDEKNKMISLSLSPAANQIIRGTLIEEIGSLAFLEVLQLSQTEIEGLLPGTFSNLYSLREFNLSENALTGTISDNFFNQLKLLELVDLSDNDMSGEIPVSIGSNLKNIEVIRLSHNRFTGELPLDNFTTFSLKKLDVSKNQLSGRISPSLLKHRDLEYLDIGVNFFVGSIEETIFGHLTRLQHFDVSQNELMGVIPSVYHNASNITYFDVHKNQFTGTFPKSLSDIATLEYLNLQGNKITGRIPFELNNLENLHTLVLSHNQFKGSIPISFEKLPKLNIFRLHTNQLSGEAPMTDKKMESYITDCGYPSASSDPIDCPSCTICCNSDDSDGVCQVKTLGKLSQVELTVIFVVSIITLISMCYVMKDYITSIKYLESFFSETVFFWNAMMLISDRSVYHFLIAKNKTEWFVAVCCVLFQTATLFLFVHSADMANEISDRIYTMICPANSLECEDSNSVSPYGIFIFGVILAIWLLRDIIDSIKLMLVSFQKRSIDFFFASAVIFTVTMLSLWTSVYYILAIATKNTDMIKDAVVLLFVVEIDERIFQLVETMNPDWVKTIDGNMRSSFVYGGDDLVITTWATKFSKSLESMRQKIRERYESFRKRSSRESVKSEEGFKNKCGSDL